MSSNDKARNKLVDSTRKGKASASKKTDDPTQSRVSSTDKKSKIMKKVIDKKITSKPASQITDPYQGSPRVWPD